MDQAILFSNINILTFDGFAQVAPSCCRSATLARKTAFKRPFPLDCHTDRSHLEHSRVHNQRTNQGGTMNRLNLAVAVALSTAALSSFAVAADIPVKAPPRLVAPFSWTGFYVGAHVGGAWSSIDTWSTDPLSTTFSVNYPFAVQEASSWIWGAQAGYNLQFNQVVIGVEGTFSGTHLHSNTSDIGDINVQRTNVRQSTLKWLSTGTGRLGFAADKWLFYVKGGGAWAERDVTNQTVNNTNGVILISRVGEKVLQGWTAGGGAEWAINDTFSFKLEYDYVKFSNTTTSTVTVSCTSAPACANSPVGDINSSGLKGDLHMVVAGINAHFNWFGAK
jgi:outer membrane immunogenic protein